MECMFDESEPGLGCLADYEVMGVTSDLRRGVELESPGVPSRQIPTCLPPIRPSSAGRLSFRSLELLWSWRLGESSSKPRYTAARQPCVPRNCADLEGLPLSPLLQSTSYDLKW